MKQITIQDALSQPTQQIEVGDGRFYRTAVGILPDVMTILQATTPQLDRARLERLQHKHEKLKSLYQATKSDETICAIRVHQLIEQWLDGNNPIPPADIEVFWNQALSVLKMLDMLSEHQMPVFHAKLKYAGTLDLIAQWQGEWTLIHWKTSQRLKRREWLGNAFMETAAYAKAYSHMGAAKIDRTMVVVLTPERSQIFQSDPQQVKQHFEQFQRRLQQFKAATTEAAPADTETRNTT